MKVKPTRHPGEVVLELNRSDPAMLDRCSQNPAAGHFRIKRILVPIDFSDCARKALQYALPLAQEHEATLTLLYAVPPVYPVNELEIPDYAAYQTTMQVRGEKELRRWVEEEVRGAVPADCLVRQGTPELQIIEAARTLPADLIIISTHGRTGLKHVLLGSVSERVIRRAPCPVLVVREREHEFLAGAAEGGA